MKKTLFFFFFLVFFLLSFFSDQKVCQRLKIWLSGIVSLNSPLPGAPTFRSATSGHCQKEKKRKKKVIKKKIKKKKFYIKFFAGSFVLDIITRYI